MENSGVNTVLIVVVLLLLVGGFVFFMKGSVAPKESGTKSLDVNVKLPGSGGEQQEQ